MNCIAVMTIMFFSDKVKFSIVFSIIKSNFDANRMRILHILDSFLKRSVGNYNRNCL